MFLIYIIGLSTLCTINNSVLWWAERKCFFICKYLLFSKHNIQLFGHQYVQQIFLCLLSQRIYSNNTSYHRENSIYITYTVQYTVLYKYVFIKILLTIMLAFRPVMDIKDHLLEKA